jgi:hypothetical protein
MGCLPRGFAVDDPLSLGDFPHLLSPSQSLMWYFTLNCAATIHRYGNGVKTRISVDWQLALHYNRGVN